MRRKESVIVLTVRLSHCLFWIMHRHHVSQRLILDYPPSLTGDGCSISLSTPDTVSDTVDLRGRQLRVKNDLLCFLIN